MVVGNSAEAGRVYGEGEKLPWKMYVDVDARQVEIDTEMPSGENSVVPEGYQVRVVGDRMVVEKGSSVSRSARAAEESDQ